MKANMDTFLARVKARRTELGLTQEALSVEAGMAEGYIAYMEYKRNLPRLDKAAAIADVLGVSLDWLCGRVDAVYPTVMPWAPGKDGAENE